MLGILSSFFYFSFLKDEEYNCTDFLTQKEAQTLFLKSNKDIYDLDRDHDKIACESLP